MASLSEQGAATYKVNTTSYTMDPSHSLVEFSVKHLGISTVRGHFRLIDFSSPPPRPRASCMIVIDENNFAASTVEASIDTATIDTGLEERDQELRSEKFLDVQRYPTMTFRSTAVQQVDDTSWKVIGDLTLKGVTRSVVLDTLFEGRGPGQNGIERVAFSASTSIRRSDFGITHNPVVESGATLAGEEVRISLELECPKFARVMQTHEEWSAIEAVKQAERELEEANEKQDVVALERLVAEDVAYYAGTGASQTRDEWIASLRTRNTENGVRAQERTRQRAKDQNRGTVLLLSGLRVGEEQEYEIEYHKDVVLTNKLYAIQDSMPGEPLKPGPERHLRFVRAWRLDNGQWRMFSHRYIHALD